MLVFGCFPIGASFGFLISDLSSFMPAESQRAGKLSISPCPIVSYCDIKNLQSWHIAAGIIIKRSRFCGLPSPPSCGIVRPMSNREIAIDLIRKLPETASLHDIAREIEFVAGVREGFEQLERGEGVPAEQVRELIPSWIVR